MRKVVVSFVLVALFACGIGFGMALPSAEAVPSLCWGYCDDGVAVQCCKVHGQVLCWVAGTC